LNLF
jgi:hypothetical protein